MWILKDNSEVSVLFFSHMSFGWYFRSLGLVVRAFTSEPSCLSHKNFVVSYNKKSGDGKLCVN